MPNRIAADFMIRQLHARYVDAAWRKDGDALAGCFTESGQWLIAGMKFQGRVQIAAGFNQFIEVSHCALMNVAAPRVLFDGQQANGKIQVSEIIQRKHGPAIRTIGYYHDSYCFEDGRWLFSSRRLALNYRGNLDLSDPLITTE